MVCKKRLCQWLVLAIITVSVCGCVPEDSIEWSDDGTVGIAKIGDKLVFFDGKSSKPQIIAEGEIGMGPTISSDGRMIAYTQEIDCRLDEGLGLLMDDEVEMIKQCAKQMRKEIIARKALSNNHFPKVSQDKYHSLVIRYMCENADKQLIEVLGTENLKKGKGWEIKFCQLIVMDVNKGQLGDKKIIPTNLSASFQHRISPDRKYVAYLVEDEKQGNDFDFNWTLYLKSIKDDKNATQVSTGVALGYCWRRDSKAIAYVKNNYPDNNDSAFGLLCTTDIIESEDKLQIKTSELAVLFSWPFAKVEYGIGGRIFFPSTSMTMPISTLDEPKWSIFCYDPVTAKVTNVLPSAVSLQVSELVVLFDVSPDGRKLLFPIEKKYAFMIYELGKPGVIISNKESDLVVELNDIELAPAWKGNDEICGMVPKESKYLKKHDRDEIAVFSVDGKFRRVLSEKWFKKEKAKD